MNPSSEPKPTRETVQPWVRWVVSFLVVAHFFAIGSAIVAPPLGNAAPSPLAAGMYSHVTRHYLEFTSLTNNYRFYAPNPAIYTLAWFRLQHADGRVQWIEWPHRADYMLHMRYQRRLGIGLILLSGLQPDAKDPPALELTPAGEILVGSAIRYAVRTDGATADSVKEVQLYLVEHRVRFPLEIQAGWRPLDLRLYLPRYVGSYSPQGVPLAPSGPRPVIPMSVFSATLLREDILPTLSSTGQAERAAAAERLPLPDCLRDLLKRCPELLDSASQEMDAARVRSAVEKRHSTPAPSRDWPVHSDAEW